MHKGALSKRSTYFAAGIVLNDIDDSGFICKGIFILNTI